MNPIKSLLGAAVVATGLSFGFAPQAAQAQSLVDVARVIVGINDIVYRGGVPYYRYGNYGQQDRVIVVRERGRNVYYRNVYRPTAYRNIPRGNAYGYYANGSRGRYQDYRRNDYRRDRDHDRRDDRRWGDRDDDNDQGRGHGRHGRHDHDD